MTKFDFVVLCHEHNIDPLAAIEDDRVRLGVRRCECYC